MFVASRHSATSCCLIAIGSLMLFVLFGFVESPTSALASEGPVAAYSFDEGEGGTLEDVTGNGHDGTIEGAEWTNGRYGTALKFDGEEDCVAIPESPELDLSEEFTLEAWVKPEGELKHDPIIFKEGEGFPSYALGIGIPHSDKAEGVIGQEGKTMRTSTPANRSKPRSGAIWHLPSTAPSCAFTSMANWSPAKLSKTLTQAARAR